MNEALHVADRRLAPAVAEEIRVRMTRRRLSQTELANLLGERQWWVSRRVNGTTPITLDDLERIARALSVAVIELLPEGLRRRTDYYVTRLRSWFVRIFAFAAA